MCNESSSHCWWLATPFYTQPLCPRRKLWNSIVCTCPCPLRDDSWNELKGLVQHTRDPGKPKQHVHSLVHSPVSKAFSTYFGHVLIQNWACAKLILHKDSSFGSATVLDTRFAWISFVLHQAPQWVTPHGTWTSALCKAFSWKKKTKEAQQKIACTAHCNKMHTSIHTTERERFYIHVPSLV